MKQTTLLEFVLAYAIAIVVGFIMFSLFHLLTKRDGDGDYPAVLFFKQFILGWLIIKVSNILYETGQFFKRTGMFIWSYWNSDDAHPESLY